MTIETSLIQALQTLLPTHKFILARRNGVQPKSVYCLVTLLNEKQVGRIDETLFLDNDQQEMRETVEAVVRLTYYGDSTSTAYSDAKHCKSTIRSSVGRYTLSQNGYSLQNITDVTQASSMMDTKLYTANTIDLTVLTVEQTFIALPSIDVATITGEYSEADGVHQVTTILEF
jgi:hypothetical protein